MAAIALTSHSTSEYSNYRSAPLSFTAVGITLLPRMLRYGMLVRMWLRFEHEPSGIHAAHLSRRHHPLTLLNDFLAVRFSGEIAVRDFLPRYSNVAGVSPTCLVSPWVESPGCLACPPPYQ